LLRIDRVLGISKRIFNGISRMEGGRDISMLKNMGYLILGSLDILEINLRNTMRRSKFNFLLFFGFAKSLKAKGFAIPIVFKKLKKIRLILIKMVTMRDS